MGYLDGLIFAPSKNGLKESKPIGHKTCINTPHFHKHCTIKWRGHVEMSEREDHTFAD